MIHIGDLRSTKGIAFHTTHNYKNTEHREMQAESIQTQLAHAQRLFCVTIVFLHHQSKQARKNTTHATLMSKNNLFPFIFTKQMSNEENTKRKTSIHSQRNRVRKKLPTNNYLRLIDIFFLLHDGKIFALSLLFHFTLFHFILNLLNSLHERRGLTEGHT